MADQGEEASVSKTDDNDDQLDDQNKNSKKNKKTKKKHEDVKSVDEELSKLLDSALEDFYESNNAEDKNSSKSDEEKAKPVPPSSLWDEEFHKLFEERLQQSFRSGFGAGDTPLTAEQLGQNIQSLAEAVTQMGAEAGASPDVEFSNFFAKVLKQCSEAEDATQRLGSEEEFRSMINNFSSCLENSEISVIFPVIYNIMQNLFTKEVFYADMKKIVEKYPQWLEYNKLVLPADEYDGHMKKLHILQEICQEMEKESSGDSEDVKRERCDRLLMLMLQVQDLGAIPPELAGDLGPILGLDSHEGLYLK